MGVNRAKERLRGCSLLTAAALAGLLCCLCTRSAAGVQLGTGEMLAFREREYKEYSQIITRTVNDGMARAQEASGSPRHVVRILSRSLMGLCMDSTAAMAWCDRWEPTQGIEVVNPEGLKIHSIGSQLRSLSDPTLCLQASTSLWLRLTVRNRTDLVWAACNVESNIHPEQLWVHSLKLYSLALGAKGCMDIPRNNEGGGTKLQLVNCNPRRPSQKWDLVPWEGETFERSTAAREKCANLAEQHPSYTRPYMKDRQIHVFPYINCASKDPEGELFTLMTQTDLDSTALMRRFFNQGSKNNQAGLPTGLNRRVVRLAAMAHSYDGAISVKFKIAMPKKASMFASEDPDKERARRYCHRFLVATIGLWLPENIAEGIDAHVAEYHGLYNTNTGRTLALEHARTPYIVTVDVDFVMPIGMADQLAPLKAFLCGHQRVILMTDFEIHSVAEAEKKSSKGESFYRTKALPGGHQDVISMEELAAGCQSKDVLRKAYNAGLARRYHEDRAQQSGAGYSFDKWFQQTEVYQIPISGIQALHEGFYAFHRDDNFPRFDEAFEGRGFNRVSQSTELRIAKYEFWVHPTLAICHPAERFNYKSQSWGEQNRNKKIYYMEWMPLTKMKYANETVLHQRAVAQQAVRQSCPTEKEL
mmetsp:Transcript_5276/g.14720  ORF Transcript_5276/g.14720 Transcript_5276/m.14720 type:complete len:644 (+) Transcript_5276:348-2279(+)